VGHREKLLDAAKACLVERGYARTTARDLVAASGTNLASIGYHFGSKEALLTEAMVDAFADLGAQLDAARERDAEAADGSAAELRVEFERVIGTFATHRNLWVSSFEAFAQVEHQPELRRHFADLYEEMRAEAAAELRAVDPSVDDETARAYGSVYLALMGGLTIQWLLDPDRAPTSEQMATGLRALLEATAAAPGRASSGATEPAPPP
jgi:AcrR family transcriptional regulator